jgi:hypothetical protein
MVAARCAARRTAGGRPVNTIFIIVIVSCFILWLAIIVRLFRTPDRPDFDDLNRRVDRRKDDVDGHK